MVVVEIKDKETEGYEYIVAEVKNSNRKKTVKRGIKEGVDDLFVRQTVGISDNRFTRLYRSKTPALQVKLCPGSSVYSTGNTTTRSQLRIRSINHSLNSLCSVISPSTSSIVIPLKLVFITFYCEKRDKKELRD